MARKLKRTSKQTGEWSDDEGSPSRGKTDGAELLGRRSYLKIGAAAVATFPTTAVGAARTAPTVRHGIEFDRVLDAVADLGMDPTGEKPVDGAVRAAGDDTLIQFPDGTYRFDTGPESVSLTGKRRGLEGRGDGVTFRAPPDRSGYILDGPDVNEVFVGSVDVDGTGARAGIRLDGTYVAIENVSAAGQQYSRSSVSGTDRLTIEGTGRATNYEITVDGRIEVDGASPGHNSSGASAEGTVESDAITYVVDGKITDFRLDGAAGVSVNGDSVPPETLGSTRSHRLAFEAATDYEFTVGRLYPSPSGGDDRVSDSVSRGTSVYRFAGGVESLSARGTATLTFDTGGS